MKTRYLAMESWRQLKNVRSLIFSLAIPVVMLLIFANAYGTAGIDPVTRLPWAMVTTVQMGAYGGMMAALGQAFVIVTERSIGWNRQLRITPLSGTGYLVSKVVAAMAAALLSIVLIFVISAATFHPAVSLGGWVLSALGLWAGILPFTLIAIMIGQFARPQFAQPLFMAVFFGLAILGGLWVPLQIMPSWVTDAAKAVPSYWLNRLGDMGASAQGQLMQPAMVLLAWTVVLVVFISWRYRRDAARA
ncbi:ABC transporter permease [Gryllotalpicola protaetiae]|uniref:ABC transporter permease n=1 Tax=Gryllotalpicola protaetiae TaxID=2419771 RepID=A0A387BGT6_9MICO|nr:ABC transporter permease [Gryllotalpicola protaetiae]AYG03225.1 ABC transporter permease [Gryllotalpicola protaetiae]